MLLCVKLPVGIVELWERKIFTVILIVENVKMVCRAVRNMLPGLQKFAPCPERKNLKPIADKIANVVNCFGKLK